MFLPVLSLQIVQGHRDYRSLTNPRHLDLINLKYMFNIRGEHDKEY